MGTLNTPIVFLIFNRPDTTEKVFAEIAKARPSKLFVVADGPRDNHPDDVRKCLAARETVERIDWKCKLYTDYSERNLGCRSRVTSGLDWVFANVEEAIVLEDDCVPAPSFFRYCQELLDRYRSDTRVMQICGFNRMGLARDYPYSYYFSQYGPVWGWASWRRAWRHNDVRMEAWTTIKRDRANHFFCIDRREAGWRTSLYNRVHDGEIDTWDYQWGFAKFINSGLSIIPKCNLIENIGFRDDATHTKQSKTGRISPNVQDIDFPLIHPPYMLRNLDEDLRYLDLVLPSIRSRFPNVSRMLSKVRQER